MTPQAFPTANQLYHNNGNSNAWLRVKLVGTSSNRDAVGAKERALANYAGAYRWQRRDITGGDEDNGNRLSADFGLGNATIVNQLKIEWPSGIVQQLLNVPANQILTVVEPRRPLLTLAAGPAGFTESLQGDTNQLHQVQFSDDLLNWAILTNITTDATGTAVWTDATAAPEGRRFYRAQRAQ